MRKNRGSEKTVKGSMDVIECNMYGRPVGKTTAAISRRNGSSEVRQASPPTELLSAISADCRAIGRGNDTGKGRHKDKHGR